MRSERPVTAEPLKAPRTVTPGSWLAAFANLAVGEAATSVLRFLCFLWVARQLGPALFGTVSAALVAGGCLAIVAHSGLEIIGTRRVAARPEATPDHLGDIVGLRLALAAGVYALTFAVTGVMDLDSQTRAIILIYALLVFTQAADVRWAFIGIQRTRPVAVASVLSSGCYLAGVVLFVRDPEQVLFVPSLQLGSEALLALILIAASQRRFGTWRSRLAWAPTPATLKATLPITLVQCARTGAITGDVVLVRLLQPAAEAGRYAAASRFALAGIVFIGLYYVSFLASLVRARADAGEFRRLTRLAARRAATVAVPLAAVITVAIPPATRLLLSPRYQATAGLLQVLVWGLVLLAFTGIYSNVLLAVHRERRLAAVTVAALVVNVGVNLVLLPTVGTVGASMATLISEGILLVGCWLSARPYLNGVAITDVWPEQ